MGVVWIEVGCVSLNHHVGDTLSFLVCPHSLAHAAGSARLLGRADRLSGGSSGQWLVGVSLYRLLTFSHELRSIVAPLPPGPGLGLSGVRRWQRVDHGYRCCADRADGYHRRCWRGVSVEAMVRVLPIAWRVFLPRWCLAFIIIDPWYILTPVSICFLLLRCHFRRQRDHADSLG